MKCNFLLSRILSVFNLLKRVGFAVLVLGGAAHAQPQAPIEWGEIQLLQSLPDTLDGLNVSCRGDTIVLFAARRTSGFAGYPAASISTDGGESWNPWYVFWEGTESARLATSAAFMSEGIYCCLSTIDNRFGLYRSTDLGHTWIAPTQRFNTMFIQDTFGDTIVCSSTLSEETRVTWTSNGGQSFAPLRVASNAANASVYKFAVSQSRIHLAEVSSITGFGQHADYCSGPLASGQFEPLEDISPMFTAVYTVDIDFDDEGNGVYASIVSYGGGYHPGAVVIQTTNDNGDNWSTPDTINPIQSADPFTILVRNNDNLWFVFWADSQHVDDWHPRGGGWVAFSANGGKSWYPRQHAYSDSLFFGDILNLSVSNDRVDLYSRFQSWNGILGDYFFKWSGEIRVDSVAPIIEMAEQFPVELPLDTTIVFSCQAIDLDSVWKVDVVLQCHSCEDSTIVHLALDNENRFFVPWVPDLEPSEWTYYYRAEDMWENTTFYPPGGSAEPWHFAIGNEKANDELLFPNSLTLYAYPNPFNSTLSISLDVPLYRDVTLGLYDLLGREVDVVYRGRLSSSTISYVAPAALSSGVYFLRAASGEQAVLKKVVLLK